ncbi:sigma-B regulation protein RsbU (phosphoserine phosphatase) [Paenibacillus sp. W4I10]|uniref:PAS domain-containing protein n=1 Tax=Paenibacillus sp. W4I10 TaxID=3042298 RepID=UPI0027889A7D|nr:PAS domain-containing protein [Paenibacillus sp. W4I10]MDQ0723501.1 sigma-B regulation protein RsbU (phosphoserine phosphatase) [Paenibacillus sp. W4I10]
MDERLDLAPCGYLSMDQNRTIRTVNATFCHLLQYEKQGVIGTSFESLLTRSSQIFFRIYFLPLINLNRHVDEMYLMMKTGSGGTLPVLLNAVLREREDETFHDCVLIPILGRKEYEQQIEQAESAYRKAQFELQRIEQELENKKEELASLFNPEV